jgi:transposase
MHDAGIDISKNRLDLCVVDETGTIALEDQLPNTEIGYDKLTELVEPETPIGLEVGTLAYPVHDFLVERDYTVRLGDSQRMKTIWQCDQTFDGKDAFEIADLVRIDKFPEVHIPDPSVLEARELIRARKEGVEQATQAKQRLGSYLRREGIQPPFDGKTLYSEKGREWLRDQELDPKTRSLMEAHLAQIEALEPRVEELDEMVADLIVDDEIVDRLVSIPGVGLHNAAVLRFEIGSMDRFDTINHFRAYAGGAPRNRQSGGPARQEGPVSRCNKRVKAAVGIAAESAAVRTKGENPVKAMDQRQRSRGKSRSRALGHARGKLCNTVYAVWTKNEECCWQNEATTENKRLKIKPHGPPGPGFMTASPR